MSVDLYMIGRSVVDVLSKTTKLLVKSYIKKFIFLKLEPHEKCPNTGKYGPEVIPYLDTFHAVGC